MGDEKAWLRSFRRFFPAQKTRAEKNRMPSPITAQITGEFPKTHEDVRVSTRQSEERNECPRTFGWHSTHRCGQWQPHLMTALRNDPGIKRRTV